MDSLWVALLIAAMELIAMWVATYRHRSGNPFEGGALVVYRVSVGLGVASLLCVLGAALILLPEARGLLVVGGLIAFGVMLAGKLRSSGGGGRGPTLHAQTQAAQPAQQPQRQPAQPPDVSGYTVRTAPQPVRAGGANNQRSARVRRIQAMEEQSWS